MNVIIYLLAIIGFLLIVYIVTIFIKYRIPMIWEKFKENCWRRKYMKLEKRPPIAKCYCKYCKWYEDGYCEYYHDNRKKLDFCNTAKPKIIIDNENA